MEMEIGPLLAALVGGRGKGVGIGEMVGSGALGLGWGRWLWPWVGPGVRAPAGISLPPYSTCFSIKNKTEKIKKRKRR